MESSTTSFFRFVLGVGGICGAVYAASQWYGITLFSVMYYIYTSPFGRIIHEKQLEACKDKDPHSDCSEIIYLNAEKTVGIQRVAMIEDNFGYLVIDFRTRQALAVDPSDPVRVKKALNKLNNIKLKLILSTHYHYDHDGGNSYFSNLHKGAGDRLEIIGGPENVSEATRTVQHGDIVRFGEDIEFQVILTPGHTTGHISFFTKSLQTPVLFTGDFLFLSGVGKFFEPKPIEKAAKLMFENIYNKIWNLPDDTLICCGHEYSASNLEYAAWVEPENSALKEKYEWVVQQRRQRLPTVPSTLAEEKSYNPFMRIYQIDKRIVELYNNKKEGRGDVVDASISADTHPVVLVKLLRLMKDGKYHQKG